MANSDGQVRIYIDTNAKEAAKALDDVDKSFKKNADTVKSVSTVYNSYERAIQENVASLREMALGGGKNSAEFQRLAQQTRDYKKALDDANKSVDEAVGGMDKQENGMSSLMRTARSLVATYVSLRGAQMLFNYALQAVDAYRTQERAILSLNTTLQNAGVYTAAYSQQIQNLASEIQSYSNYGDEAVIKAVALGQAFAGQIPITAQATKAVVDFAAATGMDLEQAFSLFGKSVGTSTNALARYGVELKKGMTSAQKMASITKQLGDRYKDQAEKMADATIQLKNTISDLAENIGEILNPMLLKSATYWKNFTQRIIDARNQMKLLATDNSQLETVENAVNKKIALEGELYRLEKKYKTGQTTRNKYEKRKGEIQQEIKLLSQWGQVYAKRQIQEEKLARSQKPIKYNDEYDIGTSENTKHVKDAFEQAQEKAQNAEKAFKAALKTYGENSNQVETARKRWEETKAAVDTVQRSFEELTAKTRTPFEQLNYNLEMARQNLQNLTSADVVDIEAVRQAQTEYQKWNQRLKEVNQYLQPTTGAYQQLQDKVSSLTQSLRDLAAENKVGTTEWVNQKTALTEAQAELDQINKSLKDNGINIEEVSKSISSSLSSGLITALRTGGNAFDAFSNLAVSALQKVLDKLIEMAIITPILDSFTGGIGGTIFGGISKLFGSANGNVFKNGNVVPFARGGIVKQPTIFPMANGGTGLMGEAGAEAVMPLRRMSNGRLGVEADAKNATVINIYNQSQSQIETRKRDDGSMDIIVKRVNEALMNERTSSGFRAAYQREDRKGLQAV